MSVLRLIEPENFIDEAGVLGPLLRQAAERSSGKFELVDLSRLVLWGQWQLWTATEDDIVKTILLTRIVFYPRLKACEMLAAVGEDRHQNMIPFLDQIERWAVSQGCALMQPICRPGWERALAPFGYQRTHVLLEKPL